MQLVTQEIVRSPETPDNLRVMGVIRWGKGEELRLWVDIPERYIEVISETGNPWLVAMLPMAASLDEDIELSLPVDALLLENVRGVMKIWKEWYPELHSVDIRCPVKGYAEPKSTRTATFFSGGVDSYFSIARRMPQNPHGIPAVGKVDDLLTVWGFDVGVSDEAQFRPLVGMLSESAQRLALNHIIVRTNLREVMPIYRKQWGPLTHGAGLAFIGLMLERRYGEIVLGSTYPYGVLSPWGSHPLVDPLFSTSGVTIVHDGAAMTRIGKTELAARLPETRRSLHVCQAAGLHNCSRCEKCYRTMIALDILGLKEAFNAAFDWSDYTLLKVSKVYVGGGLQQIFYKEMISAAQMRGREDVVKALRYSSRRSGRLAPFVGFAEQLVKRPIVWRLGIALRRWLLSGSIQKEYIAL
ncbi:MAG: hypothetical protein EPO47_00590 [Rugosibacter sp.]|nr:MAG: hypothetical protein EPO47_00590 [Rugosibacter sp.]